MKKGTKAKKSGKKFPRGWRCVLCVVGGILLLILIIVLIVLGALGLLAAVAHSNTDSSLQNNRRFIISNVTLATQDGCTPANLRFYVDTNQQQKTDTSTCNSTCNNCSWYSGSQHVFQIPDYEPNFYVEVWTPNSRSPQFSVVIYPTDYFLAGNTFVTFTNGRYNLSMVVLYDTGFVPASEVSFAPPRANITAKFFVDGEAYYYDVYQSMMAAKKTIFITDWWLSPQVYLVRGPNKLDITKRLDMVLKQKATEGVKIYILLYKEEQSTPEIDSSYAASYLQSLNPNILVIAHRKSILTRWSHHQKTVCIDNAIAYAGGLDFCYGRYDNSNHTITDYDPNFHVWPGPDYYNREMGGNNINASSGSDYNDDLFNRTVTPRVPWHDTEIRVDGLAAVDVAFNFIQRWNSHIDDLKLEGNFTKLNHSTIPGKLKINDTDTNASFTAQNQYCQVVRSITGWSGGESNVTEASIHAKILNTILKAQKYIYVENQFFVSDTGSQSVESGDIFIQNQVATALLNRIELAIRTNQTFRVFIVLPTHPEGDVHDISVRGVFFLSQLTINRGNTSLIQRLHSRYGSVNLTKYLIFLALRKYGNFPGNFTPQSEHIYVHSKTMVVDDRYVLIGSANMNDRSLLGDRDSELCIYCENDPTQNPSGSFMTTLNGGQWQASKFAYQLRTRLFNEHLGLPFNDTTFSDILNDTVFSNFRQIVSKNTFVYDHVFPHNVNDLWRTMAAYDNSTVNPVDPSLLVQLQGRFVEYPLNFTIDDPDPWSLELAVCDQFDYCYEALD